MRSEKRKCDYGDCPLDAYYSLFRTVDGEKKWVNVCAKHEAVIATENIARRKKKERGNDKFYTTRQ